MENRLAIGVDLGGTKIAAALVREDGQVLYSSVVDTKPEEGEAAVMNRITEQIELLMEQAPSSVCGVGLGSPGFINNSNGVVADAVNLGWVNIPLIAEIKKRLSIDLPVHLLVDTNASALGELYFGAGKDLHDFLYISIGTGIGAGVVVNKKLVSGANGLVGFIGHYSREPLGALCPCGLRDCPEIIVSGSGLVRLVRDQLAAGAESTLKNNEDLNPHQVLMALQQKDRVAVLAFDQMLEILADVATTGIAWLNPEALIIGGGIGLASFEILKPLLLQKLNQRLHHQHLEDLSIFSSVLTSSAIGAACLVFHQA